MGYTDKELVGYSQMAYDTLPEIDDSQKGKITVEDALKESWANKFTKNENTTSSEEFLNQQCKELGCTREDMQNWKVIDVHDKNKDNGFYAYIIETSPGNAVIAFRGSESMEEYVNRVDDWVMADFMLVNNYCTEQQAEVLRFLRDNKDILENYNITITGHSLGGNLAEFATVAIAEEKDLNHLIDNVDKCVSLDAPGFSNEYIEKNRKSIDIMADKIKSKKMSIVGNLLNPLPGVKPKYYKVKKEKKGFDKHKMENWYFAAGNEMFEEKDGPETDEKIIGDISRRIDNMNPIIGDAIVTIFSGIFLLGMYLKYDFKDDIKIMYKKIEKCINNVLSSVYNWSADKINEFKNLINDYINKIGAYFNKLFEEYAENRGYTSHIIIDTYRLRDYAGRINSIHSRVINLGARMDKLYWSVGVEGAYNLMRADAVTGYSSKLRKCTNYLNDAADIFDKVERDITAKI